MKNRADKLATVPADQLAAASGGMRWEQFRRSDNVQDVRGMTPREAAKAFPAQAPQPLPPTSPGDLGSQAGRDDIGR